METAKDLASTSVSITFWSEMRNDYTNTIYKLRGANLTKALLYCQITFDVSSDEDNSKISELEYKILPSFTTHSNTDIQGDFKLTLSNYLSKRLGGDGL